MQSHFVIERDNAELSLRGTYWLSNSEAKDSKNARSYVCGALRPALFSYSKDFAVKPFEWSVAANDNDRLVPFPAVWG